MSQDIEGQPPGLLFQEGILSSRQMRSNSLCWSQVSLLTKCFVEVIIIAFCQFCQFSNFLTLFFAGFSVIRRLKEEGHVYLKLSSTARPSLITLTRTGRTMLTTLQGSGNGHPYSLFKKQFDLKDLKSPIFRDLIHSVDEQAHADNILSALLMQQTIFAPTKYPPFSEHLLQKGSFQFFQGECFGQLTSLMMNKRNFGRPARNEKELFDQLLNLAGLFSLPVSDHLQQASKVFLPSFHSGAHFLATSLIKYFGLKVSCEDAKASCCVRTEGGYSCSQCCLFHSKNCKRMFTHFQ